MILYEEGRTIYFKGKNIKLNIRQNLLISYLIEHKNQMCPIDEIARHIYNINTNEDVSNLSSSVKHLIHALNKKIAPYAQIKSKSGNGYFIELEPFDLNFKRKIIKKHGRKVILNELEKLIKQVKTIEFFLILY